MLDDLLSYALQVGGAGGAAWVAVRFELRRHWDAIQESHSKSDRAHRRIDEVLHLMSEGRRR